MTISMCGCGNPKFDCICPVFEKDHWEGTAMYQKYGSDKTRNLLVDKIENAAVAYQRALELLKTHDLRKEINDGRLEPKEDT